MGRASTQVRIRAATDTITVSHRRSPITSVTGRRHSMDMPKLPRAMSFIHFQYWT